MVYFIRDFLIALEFEPSLHTFLYNKDKSTNSIPSLFNRTMHQIQYIKSIYLIGNESAFMDPLPERFIARLVRTPSAKPLNNTSVEGTSTQASVID